MPTKAEKDATVESLAQNVAVSQGMTITPELIALLSAAVASAVRESNRDPDKEASKEREERDRNMVREEERIRMLNTKARQDNCPHMDAYDHYSFGGQRNCKGEMIYVCLQCFKAFTPDDPTYNHFLRYIKWDRMGSARN